MRYAIKGRMWWRSVIGAVASIIGCGLVIAFAALVAALVIAAFIASLKTF